jgi:hypothetical protein
MKKRLKSLHASQGSISCKWVQTMYSKRNIPIILNRRNVYNKEDIPKQWV